MHEATVKKESWRLGPDYKEGDTAYVRIEAVQNGTHWIICKADGSGVTRLRSSDGRNFLELTKPLTSKQAKPIRQARERRILAAGQALAAGH